MRASRVSVWLLCAVAGVAIASPASAQDKGAHAQASASAPRVVATEAAMPVAELDKMLAPLGDPSVDARRAALKAVAGLGPAATQAIAQKLLELRKTSGAAVLAVMRNAKDRASSKDFDLGEWLLASRSADPAGTRAALTTTALLRALAHIATTPAVRQLVLAVPDAGGSFRPEITRQVKALGELALAGLVEAKKNPSLDTQRWASNVLEQLGKRIPSDAVQTSNNQVLCDVLHAYAVVRDLDAVPAILSFVNHEKPPVRAAAREAIEAYGQDALWKLRETYSQVTGNPALDGWTAQELSRDIFAAYDKLRLQEVYLLLEAGLAKAKSGQLDLAVDAFDRVLARQPLLDRRAETAPAYAQYADSIVERDRPAALAYYRKALRVDERGPRAREIQSKLALLEAEDVASHGAPDTALLQQAVELDPGNARARALLAQIEAEREDKQRTLERWVIAGGAGAAFIAGLILFTGRRRRPPAPPPRRTQRPA